MSRFVAFLRAVNVGGRAVAMTDARAVLEELGCTDVSSFANTGNLLFSATGSRALLQQRIRLAMEARFGFELTTFVRTTDQVRTFVEESPFGTIAEGHTYFGLFTLDPLGVRDRRVVEALSTERDTVVVGTRDVHWLIRAKSTETTLGPRRWLDALPRNPTTARNMNQLTRLTRRF